MDNTANNVVNAFIDSIASVVMQRVEDRVEQLVANRLNATITMTVKQLIDEEITEDFSSDQEREIKAIVEREVKKLNDDEGLSYRQGEKVRDLISEALDVFNCSAMSRAINSDASVRRALCDLIESNVVVRCEF